MTLEMTSFFSVVEELDKVRRDVQKLDTQLITAVNQKIKLSEQLEQWQVRQFFLFSCSKISK
jgi:hypothetical protein